MASIPRPHFGKNRNFWLGIAGAIFVIVLFVGASVIKFAGIGKRDVTAQFEQGAGVTSGLKVKIAGVPVGQVSSVKLAGDHVDVKMQLDNDVHLKEDATAEIKNATILGVQFVALTTGTSDKGLSGGVIPLKNTKVPFSLSKVVNDPTYTNQFDRLEKIDTNQLVNSLDVLNKQFGNTPSQVTDALNSVGVLSKVISDRKDQFDTLLKNLDKVTKVLGDNRNSVMVVVTQGEEITQHIMQRQALIKQLLNNVANLSNQLQGMGLDNHGQLAGFINQLNTMSEGLEKNRAQLQSLLQIFPVTARQMSNALGNGPYADVYPGWLFPDNWLCFAHVIEGCKG